MVEDRYDINTGLKGFQLLKGITDADDKTIRGWTIFSHAPAFLSMEALAQLGGMHARYVCGFDFHVFLLKIDRFENLNEPVLNGKFDMSGKLLVKTQSAFTYLLKGVSEENVCVSGKFSFAMQAYGERFKQDLLQDHYKRVFSCLRG
jgi:hypothetical protein